LDVKDFYLILEVDLGVKEEGFCNEWLPWLVVLQLVRDEV
jgi:hypothetical protein